MTSPTLHIWRLWKSGHHRRAGARGSTATCLVIAMTRPAARNAGIDQAANVSGQLPPNAGATHGPVNEAGIVSPTRRPLEYTAVARASRGPNHSRVSVGK